MSIVLENRLVTEIYVKNCHGRRFNILDIKAEDFPVEVLAHQLAQINRYCGAAKHPFSVASHSVLVSCLLPERLQYDGLMHDCEEAVSLGDLISPVKRELPSYKALGDHVRGNMAAIYGFQTTEPPMVKAADMRALAIEDWRLREGPMPDALSEYEIQLADALLEHEIPWTESKRLFLDHYTHTVGAPLPC
jgi:hypothetical protein